MSALLKGKQIPVACDLARKTNNVVNAVKLLADEARAAGLHEFAQAFDVIADGAARTSVELDCSARQTFVAARRGETLPS